MCRFRQIDMDKLKKIAEGILAFFVMLGIFTVIFAATVSVVLLLISFIVWAHFPLSVYTAGFRVAALTGLFTAAILLGKYIEENM